jgi:hypothetical protein
MVFKIIKLIIKTFLILVIGGIGGFLADRYFLSDERPTIINKTEKIFVNEEKGIVEVVKKIQPSVVEVKGNLGCIVSADGVVATLEGIKTVDKDNLPVVDLRDWDNLELGERVVLVSMNRVDSGVVSQIKKDAVFTNIEAYTDVNGAPVADLDARVIGLAKVVQGKVRVMPIELSFGK